MNKPTKKPKNPAAVALGKIKTPKKAESSRKNAALATQAKKLAAHKINLGLIAHCGVTPEEIKRKEAK